MIKLYGSKPSPYVRRLRLLLRKIEHQFVVAPTAPTAPPAPTSQEILLTEIRDLLKAKA